MPLCGAALPWRVIERPKGVSSWDFNEWCKVAVPLRAEVPSRSSAVHIGAILALVRFASCSLPTSPPLRRIATNTLLSASVDVISHSTQPRLRSQHWIPCGTVFGPHACFHSSCAVLPSRTVSLSTLALSFYFPLPIDMSCVPRSPGLLVRLHLVSDVLSSPFS